MADDEQPAPSPEGENVEETEAQDVVADTPVETPEAPEAQADVADTAPETPEAPEAQVDVPAEAAAVAAEAVEEVVEAVEQVVEAVEEDEEEEEEAPREKPAVPGAHLEVDIVPEGVDPLGRSESYEDAEEAKAEEEDREEALAQPISTAAIDLASGARYRATGKRKSAIARVTLRPGTGTYLVNGRTLENHFPRVTLQRNIRQPLETVGYQDRMDVVARLHGGGISAQAGALRHGVSRALLEADPNLRGELKRRGFLTRDSRAKERKKAGLKKARKRPQFSKR